MSENVKKAIITSIEKRCGHETGNRRRRKDEENNTKEDWVIIASTEDVDRDGDIIRAKGWDIENYIKNPVILETHQWRAAPVAKAENVFIENDQLIIKGIKFADTEEGEKYKYLVENEFIKTVSVGFMPKKVFIVNDETMEEMKSLDEDWVERNINKINKAKRVIWEAELLEISFVPVPANPNALIVMAGKGLQKAIMYDEKGNEIEIDLTTYEVKNPIPPSVHPRDMKLDDKSSWDKDKAERSLRKWASKDGSGDKDTIDWTKYRKGFTWYDANAPENFGSYKYPTHWIDSEGNFVLVWRGTASAMAYFNTPQGRKNIPADDYRGVYNHLASEYRKFGKEPPPFKKEPYTIEECFKYYDNDTLEEYVKIAYKEVKDFVKALVDQNEKMNNEIKKLKNQINILTNENKDNKISNDPPSGVNPDVDSGSKIKLDKERLEKIIELSIDQFMKYFNKK